jgi:MFS family permease
MTGTSSERNAGRWRNGPLGVRNFRLLSLGQLTSTVGDFCYAVALPWLILSAPGSTPGQKAVLLGTVLACYGVPRTVLIPVGGVLADKLSPRQVMLVADAVRCVLVAALAVLAAREVHSLAFLGPVAALLGAGEGMFLPASAAIMPSLLPAESLQAGNGISAAMVQIGTFAGPVLGGILVSTAGPAPAFGVDSATFAVSAGSLVLMRTRRSGAAAEPAGPVAGVQAGPADAVAFSAVAAAEQVASLPADQNETSVWRLFRRARELQVIVMVAVLANFVIAGAFEVALPALAHARFGADGYGAMLACMGVGALIGTLIAAKLTGVRRPAVAACASFLIASVTVSFVPFLGGLPGAAAAVLTFGAAGMFGNVVIMTLLQRWAPPHMLGRVMSLVMLASIGAFPASVALSGIVVRGIGAAPFFPAAGAVLALAVVLAVSQRAFRQFGAPEQAGVDEAAVVSA